jgi:NTP pyrophosphatase (non-canonical NTP hydrolase)
VSGASFDAISDAVYTFEDYQSHAAETAMYPGRGTIQGLVYLALGLCGESGEVAEKVKKLVRDANGEVSEEARILLLKELGDCQWYIAELTTHLGDSLGHVARLNIAKLHDRMHRGVLGGNGDNR